MEIGRGGYISSCEIFKIRGHLWNSKHTPQATNNISDEGCDIRLSMVQSWSVARDTQFLSPYTTCGEALVAG
jgi:hypothetical protein